MITEEEKEELKERFRKTATNNINDIKMPKELCEKCIYWSINGTPHCENGTIQSYNYLTRKTDTCTKMNEYEAK